MEKEPSCPPLGTGALPPLSGLHKRDAANRISSVSVRLPRFPAMDADRVFQLGKKRKKEARERVKRAQM